MDNYDNNAANTNAPASRDFYMGVDLGQAQDYTAIVVLGVSANADGTAQADECSNIQATANGCRLARVTNQ